MLPIGTFINAAFVLVGGSLGLILHSRFSPKIRLIVFQALGLTTFLIGTQMSLKVENLIIVALSLIVGGILGAMANLEDRCNGLGDWVKRKLKSSHDGFTEGFVTASLLFCVGAMAILGSFEEGLQGGRTILITKGILDGFAAAAFATTLGPGVLLSVLPLILYQGSLTLFAGQLQPFFSDFLINQMTAIGGLLILGISLNLLEIKQVKVINLLPSLLIVVILSFFFH
ncbi:MAG: DUF554 domain-containing protein [bacterium]|nr:DUF554 domain-containing protein [bacterium]